MPHTNHSYGSHIRICVFLGKGSYGQSSKVRRNREHRTYTHFSRALQSRVPDREMLKTELSARFQEVMTPSFFHSPQLETVLGD